MIKIENIETVGWEPALRGMRNPLNSWDRADSAFDFDWIDDSAWPHKHGHDDVAIGPNDHDLAMRLRNAGTDHRKFLRMIIVYADITAPLYWWKEYDTYKVGTVANSCSTMHRIADHEFTMDDFSVEHLFPSIPGSEYADSEDVMRDVIAVLNLYREKYLQTKRKPCWWQMIQLLPTSYNQRRTVMVSYEVLANMYHSRKHHKLDEWVDFCHVIETLPYSELITGKEASSDEK